MKFSKMNTWKICPNSILVPTALKLWESTPFNDLVPILVSNWPKKICERWEKPCDRRVSVLSESHVTAIRHPTVTTWQCANLLIAESQLHMSLCITHASAEYPNLRKWPLRLSVHMICIFKGAHKCSDFKEGYTELQKIVTDNNCARLCVPRNFVCRVALSRYTRL